MKDSSPISLGLSPRIEKQIAAYWVVNRPCWKAEPESSGGRALGPAMTVEMHGETLRRWLREAGLWQRQRRRKPYRNGENAKRTLASWYRWTGAFMSGWKSAGRAAV